MFPAGVFNCGSVRYLVHIACSLLTSNVKNLACWYIKFYFRMHTETQLGTDGDRVTLRMKCDGPLTVVDTADARVVTLVTLRRAATQLGFAHYVP